MNLKITAILAVGLFGMCAALAQAQTAREFVLGNGMKVVVKEDRRAPTAVQMVWYKVGSMDELNGTTGISHALEHMMFKGTIKHKVGEFSRLVAEMGGRENAFTANDYTAYFQQIEKSHLEAIMALEADRMANLQFDAAEFSKEIRVVMEERRWRTDDQPMGLLNEALNAVAWTAHPYHHPVIGWMDDLDNMKVQDLAAWYRQWYAPNNATLVVAGDVDAERVLALARKYFGKIAARPRPASRPQNEPQQLGLRRVTVKAPAENPYVVLGFKVPALRQVEQDQEAYALDVLSAVLDGYENARLTANLVRTGNKATSVGASYMGVARGPVMFTLEGTPAEGVSSEQLEALLRGEVARIASEGVSEQELQRVKTQLIAAQVYKRDSVFGQAMEIGMMETTGIGQRNIERIIDRLKTVTPAQVQAVAAKYFKDDNLTVATLVPLPLEGKKPSPPPAGLLH
ncbi:pitrilysin family protein [Herbaspirillum sp. YR522]|uniref:M16 family metallopeptidase n=1 Tax=Herbaspirillum sp. YR522 TaxID=1144342 RepID=UPI00026F6DEF|nr:pitrilysin family protein [Herbaspirillum sp. YR522]EJN03340.1 putative Zn-dependent peptidase [Herbaspirillum sp. YR522]